MASSEKFQNQLSAKYGYDGSIGKITSTEFSRLQGTVYLDHAGATQYSKSQMDAIYKDLTSNVYGNPHSRHPSSKLTSDLVDQTRTRVAAYFNTTLEEYSVVFTSGATSAIKLLAETFAWSPRNDGDVRSAFVYLEDNHTSVLGVREVAAANGAQVVCLPSKQAVLIMDKSRSGISNCAQDAVSNNYSNCLFAYPAESNFSGRKYPLRWISSVKNGTLHSLVALPQPKQRWFTLLDAACLAATSPLDLQFWKPDFVPVSFYKLFGFPTGLGALLVHKRAEAFLRTTYFGGGNVLVAISSQRFHVMRPTIEEKLESGTLPFLDILALQHGFDALDRVPGGMIAICDHTFALAHYTYNGLSRLHHFNGSPLVIIYSDTKFNDAHTQGPIINFNLLRHDGHFIGFAEVEKMAALFDIHLRTGCFCNPGACQHHLGLTPDDLRHHFQAGHVCGDDKDLVDGKPTGSVRISFGYMSTVHDVDRLLEMLKTCFLMSDNVDNRSSINTTISHLPRVSGNDGGHAENVMHFTIKEDPVAQLKFALSKERGESVAQSSKKCRCCHSGFANCQGTHLSGICIYPVKSCGGFQTSCWIMGNRGFLYDRQWVVITSGGVALTQKREPRMCLIKPEIDLENGFLWLHSIGASPIKLALNSEHDLHQNKIQLRPTKVCSDRVEGYDCGDDVANWISDVLGRSDCRLLQQLPTSSRTCKSRNTEYMVQGVSLSLANEAQFLVVNRESVAVLADKIKSAKCGLTEEDENVERLVARFRPNFVIDGFMPFEEDDWQGNVIIGNQMFKVQGKCTRCQMICIDQDTGVKSKEPLLTLSATRGHKLTFGIYLAHANYANEGKMVELGDPVVLQSENAQ